jgi:hypothetical protein
MSSDDRTDQALIEHDLAQLAGPDEQDERFRGALRAELVALAAEPSARHIRPARQRHRLLAPAVAAAAALAGLVVVLVATVGSTRPGVAAAAVIRRASAAITPAAGAILHTKIIIEQNGSKLSASESWALRTRSDRLTGRFVFMTRPDGRSTEIATDGTTSELYDPAANTIYERPTSPPGPAPAQIVDPVAALRQQLESAVATVVGTTTINGSAAYEINFDNGSRGYFDRATYYPIRYDSPDADGIVEVRFVTYEYLPATTDNMRLLDLGAQHPSAGVDANPADWPVGAVGYRPIGR